MNFDTDSDTDSNECRISHETKRLRNVFERYFKKIFNSNGFIKHMNRRCNGNNDSTSYILLCEAIRRNDNKNAMALLKYYCKANDPSKDIPLQLATLAGNVEIVDMLLRKGARTNISFQDQKEPLHLICDKESTSIPDEISRIEIAKLLLEHGANINAVENIKGDTPLILSVRSKFLELTKFLLSNGADRHYSNIFSETAFHIAFSENTGIDMIEMLYDDEFDLLKTDIKDGTIFAYAVKNLMNSGFGSFCSLNEPLKPVIFLLKHGVSVNSTLDKRDNKILHMICQNHAVQTMKIFLDYGAEVNCKNVEGKTPLHFCVENQPLNFIELLIGHGADINVITNNGQSVIHYAAANKYSKVLESLIKRGLNVNAKSKDGNFTPLFNAVWSNRFENVKLLLENQANVNEKVINNQIVLHVAVDQKHVNLIDILLEYGADINLLDDYGNTALTISLYQVAELINSDWSDDDDSNITNPAECIQRKLTKHTAKLLLSGLYVSDQSMRIMNKDLFKDSFEECINELNFMKTIKILDNVTFFDLLTMSRNKLLSLMRNDVFMWEFDHSGYHKKFPIFCDNVSDIIKDTKKRLDLLSTSAENLIQIVQRMEISWIDVHLPCLIVDHILSYLNTTDLKNLSMIFSLPECSDNNL